MVLIYEHEAKGLFRSAGIPLPDSTLVDSASAAVEAAKALGDRVVVKAQVLSGGRGKAGLIKLAPVDEVEEIATELFARVHKGQPVKELLIEQCLDIDRELFMAAVLDGDTRQILYMISTEGGIDIEQVAESRPEAIQKRAFGVMEEIMPHHFYSLLQKLGFKGKKMVAIASVSSKLLNLFRDGELQMAEINPLIETKDGTIIAADARIVLDDSAVSRHKEYSGFKSLVDQYSPVELEAVNAGISFVELEGNIAFVACGAGLGMATADLIQTYGGTPANFLDVGGGANAETVRGALSIIRKLPDVDGILINVFGGITRCDEVAQGVVNARKEFGLKLPMAIRLLGTNDEIGVKLLRDNGMEAFTDMEPAIRKIVELVTSGGN